MVDDEIYVNRLVQTNTVKSRFKKLILPYTCLTNFGHSSPRVRLSFENYYGHPERAFFQKLETFGLRHTNWAEIL